MLIVNDAQDIDYLQGRIDKVKWFIQMGEQALKKTPTDRAVLISHRCMQLHLQNLELEIQSLCPVVQPQPQTLSLGSMSEVA